jgi:hypothetical protein
MGHRQQEDRPLKARDQTKEIRPWPGQKEHRTGRDENKSRENKFW